ncbi:MAG: sigma-70 family RNA polymerase sigma factor [Myxococcota bacterium]
MSSKHPELSPERVAAVLEGDREAFAELYRCYSLRVRAAVATAIRFRADLAPQLDDLLSEVWARLLADNCRQLRNYQPSRGPLGYYLRMRAWALARLVVAQHLRRADRVEYDDPLVSMSADDGLEDRLQSRDILERLHDMVRSRLDATDLALFEQVYVQGQRIESVGRALGLRRDAVYRRSHRLQAKIARIAEELLGVDPKPTIGSAIVWMIIFEHLSDLYAFNP